MNLRIAVALAGATLVASGASAVEEPFPLADVVAQGAASRKLRKGHTLRIVTRGLSQDHCWNHFVFSVIFQNADGRILDPYSGKEVQYSTPCYAWAAAALVSSGRQTNLLDERIACVGLRA